MKKFVFTLLLVFVCHLGYAQGINGLFNEFGSEKNADCVKVSSFMMSLGKMFAGHDEDCLLYTSPSPRDAHESRMPSSA